MHNALIDRSSIHAEVLIQRPVQVVYDFYRDFRNLPNFLGDVMSVELTGPATYLWTVQGPLNTGAHWTVKVTEDRRNELIRYETVGPTILRTVWELYFSPGPDAGQTKIREVMRLPMGKLGRALLAVMGKFPAEEVCANLHRLKQVIETGKVTDRSFAVAGKFGNSIDDEEM
jgi:uncharacterized membrane protein